MILFQKLKTKKEKKNKEKKRESFPNVISKMPMIIFLGANKISRFQDKAKQSSSR